MTMLARALQMLILSFALLATLWFSFWWAVFPALAVAGAVLIATGTVWLLVLQFVVFSLMGNDPAVTRPSFVQLVQAWWRELVCVLRLFGWHQALRSQAVPDHLDASTQGKRGVVMIHGFVSNRGLWVDWMKRLRSLDHAYVAVNLEPVLGSIDDYVPIIEAAVQRVTAATGLPPVLVCHSMGGLAARAWLLKQDDPTRAARIVTIGTPHHGTALARLQLLALGRNAAEMHPGSSWLQDLNAKKEIKRPVSEYCISFVCYYSNSDNIVFPATTACLDGADNRHVPGVAHVALLVDVRVMDETLKLIQTG